MLHENSTPTDPNTTARHALLTCKRACAILKVPGWRAGESDLHISGARNGHAFWGRPVRSKRKTAKRNPLQPLRSGILHPLMRNIMGPQAAVYARAAGPSPPLRSLGQFLCRLPRSALVCGCRADRSDPGGNSPCAVE